MPITFTAPLVDQPFGPGFVTSFSSSIGVVEVGSTWRMSLHLLDEQETQIVGSSTPASIPAHSGTFGMSGTQVLIPQPRPSLAIGQRVRYRAQLLNPSSVVVDQGVQDVTYDPQQAALYAIYLQTQASGQQGGFTSADRTVAKQTMALASFPLGAWLPDIIGALGNATGIPYGDELISPDRTGGGVLTRPGFGQNVFAVGIRFRVLEKPPGIGVDEGAPPSYELPLLELGLTRKLVGTETVNEDSHWFSDTTGEWHWDLHFPHEVLYWIQPGVTVRFWWLTLPLTLAAATRWSDGLSKS